MCQFIETICIQDLNICLLNFHLQRIQQTQMTVFKKISIFSLNEVIQVPSYLMNCPKIKCRILYDTNIRTIEFLPYEKKQIQRVKLVQGDEIEYALKYADRTALQALLLKKENADEIIIVKDNKISDSSYCNLVVEDLEGNFYTPARPLLNGVKRQFYLQEKKIIEMDISPQKLKTFNQLHFINAMLDLNEQCIGNLAKTII